MDAPPPSAKWGAHKWDDRYLINRGRKIVFRMVGTVASKYFTDDDGNPHLRAKISGLSNCMTWLFTFVVVEVTPTGFQNIHYRYYIIWVIINFLIVVTVYLFFPETNSRSLEEMDEIFTQSNNIFDAPRIARSLPKREHLDHATDLREHNFEEKS